MTAKPRFTLIAGRPVALPTGESKVDIARKRFGRPFAHEPGSNFIRYPEPVLTRWGRKSDWRNIK